MIIVQENKSIRESKLYRTDRDSLEEFVTEVNSRKIREFTINSGETVCVISKIPQNKILVTLSSNHLNVYCGTAEFRVEIRTISGLEQTSSCFFIITKNKTCIWFKL